MKIQINSIKNLQLVISIVLMFVLSINSLFAQQQTYENMVNRLDEIDFEMNKLTLLKQSIGMDFKKISDFSVKARSYISKNNNLWERINYEEQQLAYYSKKYSTTKNRLYVGSQIDKARHARDSITKLWSENIDEFEKNGGMLSFFKVKCNTIEELKEEYNRTADHYLKQKTEYDKINKELGRLNTEKHDLEIKLKYMDEPNIKENDLDPSGCWRLAFGNHISEITIKKDNSGKYVGTLTVNNLQDYEDGQVVLLLSRVSNNTFKGIEHTWKEKPNGMLGEAIIPAMLTINTDNNYLTWTSDQTVTMMRCR